VLGRARLALAVKMLLACLLTVALALTWLDPYQAAVLAAGLVATTVLLDYWVYRAVNSLFSRLYQSNRQEAQQGGELHESLEALMGGVLNRLGNLEALEVETVRSDLYRLRSFNNQLIRLGEIAQELNTALPYRETKAKALELSRHLLSADLVALVSEEAGSFYLEGIAGCEEGEIKVDCCSFYGRCPIRTSFREVSPGLAPDHRCAMFPPTMQAKLSLPFKLDGSRTLSLLAAAARPGAFDDISPVVLSTLVGHVQAALLSAGKYDQIRREVVTDPLTNLYNRRFFEKRAAEEISRSLRHQQPTTLLMLDVDHFKSINDTYGHQTGDKVLQAVANYLKESVRQSDICGRFGGEEFVLLLPNTPGRSAVYLADRLRRGFAEVMFTGLGIPAHVSVTISGGVATCPRDATTLDQLLRRADQALYEAKRAGRNRIVQAGIPEQAYEPEIAARRTAGR
jgi:diguanylate cyclase (GGDEF)-like protein